MICWCLLFNNKSFNCKDSCKHARRFGEINVRVPAISRKVLIEQLRELEADGLISRKQFEGFPLG
jgi:DNA-binding HxlR family transcriptional regulator